MAIADEQIRVSGRVKRELKRRMREGESFNDVLKRILTENTEADFYDGFGILSDEQADSIREEREPAREKRKGRLRRLAGEDA